jgi:hypothetical protein
LAPARESSLNLHAARHLVMRKNALNNGMTAYLRFGEHKFPVQNRKAVSANERCDLRRATSRLYVS